MPRLLGKSIVATFIGCSALAQGSAVATNTNTTGKTESAKETNRTYLGEVGFNLQGKRFDDAVVNSRFSRLMIVLSLEANYREWFSAKLGVVQLLTSGQASNLYAVTEGGTGSGTLLDEASVSLKPFKGAKASAGVLSLEMNPIFSQMMGQSNAGGSIEYKYQGSSGSSIGMEANQSIPTSKAASNRTTDQDVLPLLTMGNINMELKSRAMGFSLRAAAARFTFTDLSSQSAADSQQIGGTTIGNGKGGFLFAYEFRGNEYAAAIEQEVFLMDKIGFKGSTIKNELAPAGKNTGWQGKVEYTRAFNKFNIVPSYVRFRMESDALPATYSLLTVGFANRDGAGYGLKLDFPKEKFSVFGGYTNSKVIDTNSTAGVFQADRDIYTLGAEAKYDIF